MNTEGRRTPTADASVDPNNPEGARSVPLPAHERTLRETTKRIATVSLIGVAVVSLMLTLRFTVAHPFGTLDFANSYTAGTILRKGLATRLYDLKLQHEIQSRFTTNPQFLPFDHPPFEAYLFAPLAGLSFTQAFLVWAAFNLAVLGLVFYFLPRTGHRLDADSRLVWLAAAFPVVGGVLVLGQDSLLLAPVFLFAFLALKKRRDVVAGLVLGLGLFRFEIMLPFVFIFLLRRRWRVLAGFAAASAAWFLTSVAMIGWSGLLNYAKLLVVVGGAAGDRANGVVTATMPSLRGAVATFLGGAIPSVALFPVVLAGTLALLFWAAWQFKSVANPNDPSFDLEFSLATIVALVASYHLFVHELTPLIVAAFLMLGYESAKLREVPLLKRPGASLLLLFALVIVVGELAGFRSFSVVFVVLLGTIAWISLEISHLRPRRGVTADSPANRAF